MNHFILNAAIHVAVALLHEKGADSGICQTISQIYPEDRAVEVPAQRGF